MFPPKVSDEAICGVIRELTARGTFPSGAAVRRALGTRFGSRAGVARLYKLLDAERARFSPAPASAIGSRLQEQELRNLREQLARLHEREDQHQAYWTRQVEQLRQRTAALERLIADAAATLPQSVQQQLRETETRTGQLEVALRVFGPATGRIKP